MADLLVHPTSQRLIDAYIQQPSHGLLLSGPEGIGLKTIAQHIARQINTLSYVQEVLPDDKRTITIETVRGLYKLTRAQRDIPLVIVIDDAEAMGREAQNALLKLLEEPTENVYFILTSHAPQRLLATITSRTQHIPLRRLASGDIHTLFDAQTSDATRTQVRFLAEGLPAEAARLLDDDVYFLRKTQLMKDARAFLEGDSYARLLLIKEYSGDREQADLLLASLAMLLSFMLFQQQTSRHVASLETIETVRARLGQNAHIRTQLTYLVTQF